MVMTLAQHNYETNEILETFEMNMLKLMVFSQVINMRISSIGFERAENL